MGVEDKNIVDEIRQTAALSSSWLQMQQAIERAAKFIESQAAELAALREKIAHWEGVGIEFDLKLGHMQQRAEVAESALRARSVQ